MVFAKVLLVSLLLGAAAIALLLRFRAWRARRSEARRAWQAEVDRAIENR
ncbi:hypothetical protein [Leucobacter sp. PH1c]|nr:hypothetical protein [Leucobacter sp. PH1c]